MVATNNLWLIKELFNWYQAYCEQNNNYYVDAKTGKQLYKLRHTLTEEDKQLLSFTYKRLVQNNVIEGIKHVENGSAGFERYYLNNLTKPENLDVVAKELELQYGLSALQVSKFINIVQFAIENDSALNGLQHFLTKYNKGTIPTDPEPLDTWETFIQESTYFGSLVQPLFDIDKRIKTVKDKQQNEINNLVNVSLLDELDVSVTASSVDSDNNFLLDFDFTV